MYYFGVEAEDGKLMLSVYYRNPFFMTRTGNTIKMSENKDGNFSMFEVESGNSEEECMEEITENPKRAIEKPKSTSKYLLSSGITYNETMDIIGPFIKNKSPIALKASVFLGLKGVFFKPFENPIVSPNVSKFWLLAYFVILIN